MPLLLILTIMLPLAGAIVLFAGQAKMDRGTARNIALGVVLATLGVGLPLVFQFNSSVSGPQFAFGKAGSWGLPWIGTPDIRLAFGLDGISIGLFAAAISARSHTTRSSSRAPHHRNHELGMQCR